MSIKITENAAQRIRSQLAVRGHGLGLRIGVKPTGCSGYAYALDFADAVGAAEQSFEGHGATVVVPREQLGLLDGMTVDFRRVGLNEVFHFENPNAEALCGCGESFSVEKTGT